MLTTSEPAMAQHSPVSLQGVQWLPVSSPAVLFLTWEHVCLGAPLLYNLCDAEKQLVSRSGKESRFPAAPSTKWLLQRRSSGTLGHQFWIHEAFFAYLKKFFFGFLGLHSACGSS